MNIMYIVSLLVGSGLGAILVWLYLKKNSTSISNAKHNELLKKLQEKETAFAVTSDRNDNMLNDLNAAKEALKALQTSYNRIFSELEVAKSIKEATTIQIEELKTNNISLSNQLKDNTEKLIKANNTTARLQEELKGKEERLVNQKKDFEDVKNNLEKEFKAIAGSILADNSKTFTDQQSTKLEDLLKPFREQIDGFKKEFDQKLTTEATEKGSLKQQIESLVTLNHSIAKEAIALTEALRGSTKKQGDWGEDILERILEYSGLQKGIQYRVQQSAKNDNGDTIRPDIIVYYPDKRYLVIDAKVSLTHYWDYCNASTVEAQAIISPRITASLKGHINDLSGKRYTDIAGTPDFIIMFMPVEAAYITAMQNDHTLWQYAYDRKVLLISPTNLLPAMKMVSIMWDKDAVNRDGEEIVSKAVKLYEKFHGFIGTFESIGTELEQAHKKWNEAKGQLHTGRDNFIKQGSNLKILLGKRTAKELPAELVTLGNLEDENLTGKA